MTVSGKYELLEQISTSGTRTFRARHARLGQAVWIHFLDGGETPENVRILLDLRRIPDRQRKLFIDAGEHEGTPYLVTWPLSDFVELGLWLSREVLAASEATRAMETIPPAPAPAPPPAPVLGDAFLGTSPPTAPAAPSPALPVESAAPGEFTLFFGGGNPHAQPAAPRAAPGEFTREFYSPPPARAPEPPPPPPPPAPAPAAPADDLDRLFESVPKSAPPPPTAPAAVPPYAAGAFNSARVPEPAAPPPAAVPQYAAGAFTGARVPEPAAPPPPPPLFSGAGGPSEYTMILQSAPAAAPGHAAPAPAPPPPKAPAAVPAKPANSYLPLILILGFLLLVTLMLVLFFALKSK